MIRKRTPPCFVVKKENDELIHIEKAKRDTDYFCVNCEAIMIPKKGDIKIHHFAHKPSEDGDENFCGGEGFRHLRVKTVVNQMLKSIARHHFAYDFEFIMEKSYGQDRPDILVTKAVDKKEVIEVMAIEIIDTHPPSDEKRERWNNRMLELVITKWSDELIGDYPSLCGKLMPWLVSFDKLISSINSEQISQEEIIKKMRNEYESTIAELEYKKEEQIEKYIDQLKSDKAKTRLMISMPNIWPGSFKKFGDGTYGVTVTTEKDEPVQGDFAVIQTKAGEIYSGLLGEKISSPPEHLHYYDNVELRYDFKLLKKRKDKKLHGMLKKMAPNVK